MPAPTPPAPRAPRRRSRSAPPAAGLLALGRAAVRVGSAGAGGTERSGEPTARRLTTTTTAAPPAGTAAAPGPERPRLPVQVGVVDGTPRVTAQIEVAGRPVTVVVDTGSSGLLLAPAGGAGVQPGTATSQLDLEAGTMTVQEGTAPVSFGDVTTGPIGVGVIQGLTCAADAGAPCDQQAAIDGLLSGTDGLLGIGLADGPPTTATFDPFLQLPAPYDAGYTVDLTGPSPAVVFGAVEVGPTSVTTPFLANTPSTYPTGAPAFQKDAQLCWTVGQGSGCGLTDFDTGNPVTALAPGAVAGLPASGLVPAGTSIAVATQAGRPVWQLTTGGREGVDATEVLPGLPPPTQFNTGIAFFSSNRLGYDVANARFVITPA